MNPKTFAAATVIVAGLAFAIWMVANLWAILILAILSLGAVYLYRKFTPGIDVAEGVTLSQGKADNLLVKFRMDFPTDPSEAADFHSRVIYLQGYLARRLYDDLRISGAKVEIEAINRRKTQEKVGEGVTEDNR